MSARHNKALQERYLREVWEARDPEAEARFAASHYRRYITPSELPLVLAGQIEREKRFLVAFPDATIEAHDIVADDRFVAMRATGRGTNLGSGYPPTGRVIEISIVNLKRIEDGRFVEEWGGPDRLELARQLGLRLVRPDI
jgi:predicted ester cyclase